MFSLSTLHSAHALFTVVFPYSISVAGEFSPLAKHIFPQKFDYTPHMGDWFFFFFFAMFLPSSEKWSMQHWLNTALCGAQRLWPDCVHTVAGRSKALSDVIFTDLFFVTQPDVIFMAITYGHEYLNVTPLDDSMFLPCHFDLNVAVLLQT